MCLKSAQSVFLWLLLCAWRGLCVLYLQNSPCPALYCCAAPIVHYNDVWENSTGAGEMDLLREC